MSWKKFQSIYFSDWSGFLPSLWRRFLKPPVTWTNFWSYPLSCRQGVKKIRHYMNQKEFYQVYLGVIDGWTTTKNSSRETLLEIWNTKAQFCFSFIFIHNLSFLTDNTTNIQLNLNWISAEFDSFSHLSLNSLSSLPWWR